MTPHEDVHRARPAEPESGEAHCPCEDHLQAALTDGCRCADHVHTAALARPAEPEHGAYEPDGGPPGIRCKCGADWGPLGCEARPAEPEPGEDEAWEALLAEAYIFDGDAATQEAFRNIVTEHRPRITAAIRDAMEKVSPESRIPDGEPCPICGPKGHSKHQDDSYGACVSCYTLVPHSDVAYEKVAWPCPAAQLAAIRGSGLDVERLAQVLYEHEWNRQPGRPYGWDMLTDSERAYWRGHTEPILAALSEGKERDG